MELSGLFSSSMACRECNHVTGDVIHDRCRSHAFCSREGRYHAAVCAVCEELWFRASDMENYAEAKVSMDYLKQWIGGFRKNSKSRTKGQSHFWDEQERLEYQDLLIMHGNPPPSSVAPLSRTPQEVRRYSCWI